MNTIQNETFKAEMERDERNYHRVGIVFTVLCALFGFFFFPVLFSILNGENYFDAVFDATVGNPVYGIASFTLFTFAGLLSGILGMAAYRNRG